MVGDEERKLTGGEMLVLAQAASDFQTDGRTALTCPRCQKELTYFGNKTGCIVACKNKSCIRTTLRGVLE